MRGSIIRYDGRTEFYSVTGGPQAVTANNPDGRVRAVIQPRTGTQPAVVPKAGDLSLKPAGSISAPRENYPEPAKK